MRGPIIVEHFTDKDITGGDSASFKVKADGRAMRVFVKYKQGTTDDCVTTLKPVAHFSDQKLAVDFPEISSNNTDGIVSPDEGKVTTSTVADPQKFCIFVAATFGASEYEFNIAPVGDITELYVVTELT